MPRLDMLARTLVVASLAISGAALAQSPGPGAANVWTFSTDGSNNLVVQDLASLSAAPGTGGQKVCIQWMAVCPTDVAKPRRRYTLRNSREKNTEWRIDVNPATVTGEAMALPVEVAVGEGMVQIVSGEGPWSVDLKRVPAVELKAGEGKKWKLSINLTTGATADGCWIEVQCPTGG